MFDLQPFPKNVWKKNTENGGNHDINQDVEAEGKPHPPHFRRSYLQPSTNGFLHPGHQRIRRGFT